MTLKRWRRRGAKTEKEGGDRVMKFRRRRGREGGGGDRKGGGQGKGEDRKERESRRKRWGGGMEADESRGGKREANR